MTDTSIPKDWVRSTVGDVCALNPKVKLPDDLEVGFMPMSGVPTDFLGSAEFDIRPWEQVKKGFTQFKDGDVIFAKITPCFENGKAAIIGGLPNQWGSGSTEYYVLRPYGDLVLPRLLFALVKTKEFLVNGAVNMSGSVGHKRVPKDFVSGYQLPLPPLAEQKIIADKLDTLLAQVEATKARLERIPKILKRFRQSVLIAGMSGRLTKVWSENKRDELQESPITIGQDKGGAPNGWSWEKLVDLATLESGHTPRKSKKEYWESGNIPWISLQDIRKAHGKVIAETKFMPNMEGIRNSSARLLPKGTVCFSRDISVGFTTIMGREMATTQHFVNWICGPRLNNRYLMYAFMAAKDHLTISGQGSTVKTIYMPACKQFRLLTPPIETQHEIVRKVDHLFAYADQLENQVTGALNRINNLTQAILAKAFRGELTEQWRKDNPGLITGENSAEALLQRIKAEREQLSAQKPKRQKKSKQ